MYLGNSTKLGWTLVSYEEGRFHVGIQHFRIWKPCETFLNSLQTQEWYIATLTWPIPTEVLRVKKKQGKVYLHVLYIAFLPLSPHNFCRKNLKLGSESCFFLRQISKELWSNRPLLILNNALNHYSEVGRCWKVPYLLCTLGITDHARGACALKFNLTTCLSHQPLHFLLNFWHGLVGQQVWHTAYVMVTMCTVSWYSDFKDFSSLCWQKSCS